MTRKPGFQLFDPPLIAAAPVAMYDSTWLKYLLLHLNKTADKSKQTEENALALHKYKQKS